MATVVLQTGSTPGLLVVDVTTGQEFVRLPFVLQGPGVAAGGSAATGAGVSGNQIVPPSTGGAGLK